MKTEQEILNALYVCGNSDCLLDAVNDCAYYHCDGGTCMMNMARDARELILQYKQKMEKEYKPVIRAKWIVRRRSRYATCSYCGHSYTDVYDMEDWDNYCRHCGAYMEGLKCDD